MTPRLAVAALFDEFHLEEHVEMVRDEVKGDPTHEGLSKDHPRVKRFEDVCRTLRAFKDGGL